MISRIFLACLFLGMYSAGFSLNCKWIGKHPGDTKSKFSLHNKRALILLDMMSTKTTQDAKVEHNVTFPNRLYRQAYDATAEDKLTFAVQILEGLFGLFEEDHSSASWEESTVGNFLNIINKQAEELQSCIGSHSSTTQKSQNLTIETKTYFERLSNETLQENGYSAEAWEEIRNIIKAHLQRSPLLV